MNKNKLIKPIIAAMCIALSMVLPMITGSVPKIGNMLCPMHIPVLLSGFVCGPWYGLIVGAVSPILRSLIIGMPPMFPKAFTMMFELAAYGLLSGLFYRLLPKKNIYVYVSLISSMILGRLVWGTANAIVFGFDSARFGFSAFVSGAFTTALPGIVLQIILIPIIVIALKKSQLMNNSIIKE